MSTPAVNYHIWPENPEAHLFRVTVTVENPKQEQVFSLPAWIPGSYLVREFSKNIVRIWATSEGADVVLHRIDKHTWVVKGCAGPLTVELEVYAWDLSVRTAHLDQTHGFFNGTSMFLKVHGYEHERATVAISAPPREYGNAWRVATAMNRISGDEWSFGTFEVNDYDELIDHPVEMGTFEVREFEACGTPHAFVLTGQFDCDWDRLIEDVRIICESQINMFGAPAPMDRYLFMTMVVGDGYGGLEHRWSTALICRRESLPTSSMETMTDGYRTFLGLVSHEYFHSWNVKRIKPAAFTPYDLTTENYTTLLWAFEGITSYYDDLTLIRTGRISETSYLELLGQTATRVWRSRGRSVQTVTDSSFDAWTKFYRQDENAQNAIISYYTKGALVALCLDLKIRAGTAGKCSLDDVMHVLWARFGQTGVGVGEQDIEQIASEVSGLDLDGFFQQALYTTESVPVAECMALVGLKMGFRQAKSQADKGGKRGASDAPLRLGLSARLVQSNGGVKIATTLFDGPAQKAGLAPKDVMIAVDGLKASKDLIQTRLKQKKVGDVLDVHAFRRDELMRFQVVLAHEPSTTVWFEAMDDATEEAQALKSAWLSG